MTAPKHVFSSNLLSDRKSDDEVRQAVRANYAKVANADDACGNPQAIAGAATREEILALLSDAGFF